MTTTPDFRSLCAELACSVELLLDMRNSVRPMQITEDRLNRARAALATPPPEPVAYIHRQGNYWEPSQRVLQDDEKERGWTEEPLYAAPPSPPEPPTDEEIKRLAEVFELFDEIVLIRAALEKWGQR